MRGFRYVRRIAFVLVFSLWLWVLLQQHAALTKHAGETKAGGKSPSPNRHPPIHRGDPTRVREREDNVHQPVADATLNGVPVFYQEGAPPPASHVECDKESRHWMFRSCLFRNLCFDLEKQDFVMIHSGNVDETSSVALGGINPRWDVSTKDNDPAIKGSWNLEWFPRVLSAQTLSSSSSSSGYYTLPKNYVWVPFHSMAAHNVGHMLWDDLYPIFRLLRHWNLWNDENKFLLIRQQIRQTLYATCDKRKKKRQQCRRNLQAFLQPVMGVDPSTFSASRWVQWNATTSSTKQQQQPETTLVCAEKGVAGLGVLTDHGLADHGWDYATLLQRVPHNLGHGRDFWEFGQLVRRLYGADDRSEKRNRHRIVFSLESSQDSDRRLDFAAQRQALTQEGITDGVEAYRLWNMSVVEQLRLSTSTDIFVTACGGGGALPVTFLPRGSSLIVYYNPAGGYDFSTGERRPDWPVRLDWDLLHHAAAHVRVHWIPIQSGDEKNDENNLKLFVHLIRHELKLVDSFKGSHCETLLY